MRYLYFFISLLLFSTNSCVNSIEGEIFSETEKNTMLSLPAYQDATDPIGLKQWKRTEQYINGELQNEKLADQFLFFEALNAGKGKAQMFQRQNTDDCENIMLSWNHEWTTAIRNEQSILYLSDSLALNETGFRATKSLVIESINIKELELSYSNGGKTIKDKYTHTETKECKNFYTSVVLLNSQSQESKKKWTLESRTENQKEINFKSICKGEAFLDFYTENEVYKLSLANDILSDFPCDKEDKKNYTWTLEGDSILLESGINRKITTKGITQLWLEHTESGIVYKSEYLLK